MLTQYVHIYSKTAYSSLCLLSHKKLYLNYIIFLRHFDHTKTDEALFTRKAEI